MKIRVSRKAWLSIGATVALLVLIWVAGTALAQEPDGSAPLGPAGGSAANTFTYQGRLLEGGGPADGTYDFIVTIWDDSIPAANQVASCQDLSDQTVENGLFTFHLVPDKPMNEVFDGGERWIQIKVRPDGDGSYTTLDRQPIAPAPYAWGLRPGAVISGTTDLGGDLGDSLLNLQDTRPSHDPSGSPTLLVRNHTGAAIRARGGTTGVYGYGTTGPGISGSSGGTAGSFTSENGYGVYAQTSGTDHWDHGGYFSATAGCGVYAVTAYRQGVYGTSVYSDGVFGQTSGQSGHGGHFVNTDQGGTNTGQVGVWAGSYWDVIQGHFVDQDGSSLDRVFRVDWHGNVFADGTYYGAGGVDTSCGTDCADLAETMDADQAASSYEPGDVLVVNRQGLVSLSDTPFATNVVGVYSTKPAFLAHAGDTEDQVPVALVGNVPVKASAENGPIVPGDLLTTSSTPGHAMKADHFVGGAIIGKAMEPLDEGTGLIQMLVMLQ